MRLLIFLALGWTVFTSAIAADNLNRSTDGEDVNVAISSPFRCLPPAGAIPFRVTIRNDSSSAGSWTLDFECASMSGRGGSVFEQSFNVAGKAVASFDLVVPLPLAAGSTGGNTTLQVGVVGPGYANSSLNKRFFAYFFNNTGPRRSPFTLIGTQVVGVIGLGPLESNYKDTTEEFYGSSVDATDLPSDWRALSGVATVLLTDAEWLALDPARHDALCDYVAQGGSLTLFTTEDPATRAGELHLPGPEGGPGAYGFGNISLFQTLLLPPDAATLRSTLERHPAYSGQSIDGGFSSWDLRKSLGTIAVNAIFILTFVVIFGSLVGPINLFVFARGKNRFRLFWTTPLISIVASVLLAAGILLTDGIGGNGRQMVVIYSLPASNREVVIQEQVARTALLFSNRWRNEQNYLITPVSTQAMDGALFHQGQYVMRTSGSELEDSPDTYSQHGSELSGNWFRSRAISGQYLQAVLPSRSCLTVLNPGDLNALPVAPVVLSSFPQTLDKVFVLDGHLHYWTCRDLEPGTKQTCVRANQSDFNSFWSVACAHAGGKLRPVLNIARDRPDFFWATGTPSSAEVLNTLGEVHWRAVTGVYLGPWVEAPATGSEL